MKKKLSVGSLTFLLSLVYFTSYITRKNLGVIITAYEAGTGFANNLIGIALTCLSVTYGIGQVVNGYMGDRTQPQNLITCGLVIVTLMNLLLPLLSFSITLVWVLWAINGFAQAMMWPPIVKILACDLSDKDYGRSILIVSCASALATVCLSLLSTPIIKLFDSWQAVFFISAGIGVITTIYWFFMKNGCGHFDTSPTMIKSSDKTVKQKLNIPKIALLPLVFIFFAIILQGMLRDGIEPLLPIYLTNALNVNADDAIIITLAPAVLTFVFYYVSLWLYKRFFENEVTLGGILFGVSAFFAIVLALMFIILKIDVDAIDANNIGFAEIAPIICLTLITSTMHGVNLMLNTQVPKRFKKYGNVSTFAGVLNACTYIGSAIAFPLFLSLDWFATVIICAGITIAGAVCCFIAVPRWQKFVFGKEEKIDPVTEEPAEVTE